MSAPPLSIDEARAVIDASGAALTWTVSTSIGGELNRRVEAHGATPDEALIALAHALPEACAALIAELELALATLAEIRKSHA